jgi:uncharacterized protein YjaZ
MSVVNTEKWLVDLYEKPYEIAGKLKRYFTEGSNEDIYHHLVMHGMYRHLDTGSKVVENMKQKQFWNIVKREERKLQELWNGPNVPIFIFPADTSNRKIMKELNGKSGLAFKDKLFLFLSDGNEVKEIYALITHEYNHVCRLTKFKKSEANYTLLDSIVLEGLAENAVRERVGEDYLASYQKYYSNDQLEHIWNTLIKPNQNSKKSERKHLQLLYGLGSYPSMAGYCIGYYLVKRCLEKNNMTTSEILEWPSEKVINIDNAK